MREVEIVIFVGAKEDYCVFLSRYILFTLYTYAVSLLILLWWQYAYTYNVYIWISNIFVY
jgi:hypothetical protein